MACINYFGCDVRVLMQQRSSGQRSGCSTDDEDEKEVNQIGVCVNAHFYTTGGGGVCECPFLIYWWWCVRMLISYLLVVMVFANVLFLSTGGDVRVNVYFYTTGYGVCGSDHLFFQTYHVRTCISFHSAVDETIFAIYNLYSDIW